MPSTVALTAPARRGPPAAGTDSGDEPLRDVVRQAGADYRPVVTPNGESLPFQVVAGVKVFHLTRGRRDHDARQQNPREHPPPRRTRCRSLRTWPADRRMNTSVFQLLIARRDPIEASRSYIDALREYWVAQADLAQLLAGRIPGGGDGRPCDHRRCLDGRGRGTRSVREPRTPSMRPRQQRLRAGEAPDDPACSPEAEGKHAFKAQNAVSIDARNVRPSPGLVSVRLPSFHMVASHRASNRFLTCPPKVMSPRV